jgi:hypothetical protein
MSAPSLGGDKMRVRFLENVFVKGEVFEKDKEYEIDDELAEWLQGYYEVIDKSIDEPEKDKMVKSSKKK